MVSTLDSESSDPSSNLGGTYQIFLLLLSGISHYGDIFRLLHYGNEKVGWGLQILYIDRNFKNL